MRGAIFVGSKRPGDFGLGFSFHFSHTYRMLVLPNSFCSRSSTERLIDFLTGLLYYEDVYIVIAINPVNFLSFFSMAAHSRPMRDFFKVGLKF